MTTPPLAAMKRYTLNPRHIDGLPLLNESPHGEWVRYADVAALAKCVEAVDAMRASVPGAIYSQTFANAIAAFDAARREVGGQ